jgi:hypothetical protein
MDGGEKRHADPIQLERSPLFEVSLNHIRSHENPIEYTLRSQENFLERIFC